MFNTRETGDKKTHKDFLLVVLLSDTNSVVTILIMIPCQNIVRLIMI